MADEPLDSSSSIASFLDATAAKRPAPGGGAVAALAGALAVAIGEMVLSYSSGKKDLTQHQPALELAAAELKNARRMFLQLVVEDQTAFAELTAGRKARSANELNAESRVQEALLACINTPLIISETAAVVLEIGERLIPIVNRFLLSDLQVCAELAMATLRCGIHNVRVNLADEESAGVRDQTQSQVESILNSAVSRIKRVMPAIALRIVSNK